MDENEQQLASTMNSNAHYYDMTLDAAALAEEGVGVTHLMDGEVTTRPDPAFLFGYSLQQNLIEYKRDTHIWPVSVFSSDNVEVVGPWFSSGVLLLRNSVSFSCDRIYQNSASPAACKRLADHVAGIQAGTRTRRRVTGRAVLIATIGHEIYGHWLVDFLPKLYLLVRAGYDPDSIQILLPTNMPPFGRAYLELLGFPPSLILNYDPDRESLIVDELIIPTLARTNGRASPIMAESLSYLSERINSHNLEQPISRSSRIFISRKKSQRLGRPLLNTDEIEAVATRAKFELVYPEQLPLLNQIALFRGAKEIAGQYGSALHGTIFSPPGIVVGALQGTGAASAGFLQSGIADRLHQSVGYIFGAPVAGHASHMAFEVAIKDFEDCLRAYFGGGY